MLSCSIQRSRSLSDKEDDPDDDVSLVSRTPSPPLERGVETDHYDYDSMVPGVAREVITVETKVPATNVGHRLLAKMGWKDGQGLGLMGQGTLCFLFIISSGQRLTLFYRYYYRKSGAYSISHKERPFWSR